MNMVTSSTVPSPAAQVTQTILPALLPALPTQRQLSAYPPLYHRYAPHSHLPSALHVHARASARPDHNTHHGAPHHAPARRTRHHHTASDASASFASVESAGVVVDVAARPKGAAPLEREWVPVPVVAGLASVVAVAAVRVPMGQAAVVAAEVVARRAPALAAVAVAQATSPESAPA
jgi:hypothetical protein